MQGHTLSRMTACHHIRLSGLILSKLSDYSGTQTFMRYFFNTVFVSGFNCAPCINTVANPEIFFAGDGRGGVSANSVEDRGQTERGSGGSSPLVRGSGVSCNLVQEISFHIVKFS